MNRIIRVCLAFLLLLGFSFCIPACAANHYKKPPASTQAQDITVWVNLKTGVYHYPGSRWYGKTKAGEYLKETEARKEGFRPAENGQ